MKARDYSEMKVLTSKLDVPLPNGSYDDFNILSGIEIIKETEKAILVVGERATGFSLSASIAKVWLPKSQILSIEGRYGYINRDFICKMQFQSAI